MSVRVGVVGCGYWGPNLIRNFVATDECDVVAVADPRIEQRDRVLRPYPGVEALDDAQDLFDRDDVDAVVLATPLSTHGPLGLAALEAGKHLWVEKPLAASVAEAEALVSAAEERGLTLFVDHTFVYTGAVRTVQEMVRRGDLGALFYFDSVRVNLGLFQHDVNVLWDLGPHDLSILRSWFEQAPVRVSALGAAPVKVDAWDLPSIAYVTLWFDDGAIAHLHLNWLSPLKVRRTLVGGSRQMVVYDALEPDAQVKIFDKGVDPRSPEERYEALVQYRSGDMTAPKVDQTEALSIAARTFIDAIERGTATATDGRAGLDVVRLLEAAQASMDADGRIIDL